MSTRWVEQLHSQLTEWVTTWPEKRETPTRRVWLATRGSSAFQTRFKRVSCPYLMWEQQPLDVLASLPTHGARGCIFNWLRSSLSVCLFVCLSVWDERVLRLIDEKSSILLHARHVESLSPSPSFQLHLSSSLEPTHTHSLQLIMARPIVGASVSTQSVTNESTTAPPTPPPSTLLPQLVVNKSCGFYREICSVVLACNGPINNVKTA